MRISSRLKRTAIISLIFILAIGLALFSSGRLAIKAAGTSKLTLKSRHSSFVQITRCGAWSIITSPSPGAVNNNLSGVAAITKNNVWAVGRAEVHTLIEHWNGTKWSVIPSPSPGTGSNGLSAITALSANNIWVVGASGVNGGFPKTLIGHWNGKKWSVVTSPSPGTGNNTLFAVAAVSANDIWAVGQTNNNGNGFTQTLVEHWNGKKWSVVTSPNLGTGSSFLASIAIVSTNNVWAVGSGRTPTNSSMQTLIEHWDGTSWSIVPSPNAGQGNSELSGVAVISARDIFVAGSAQASSNSFYQTLIEHWDGSSWSMISSPNVSNVSNWLKSITEVSSNNVWVVGYSTNAQSSSTLIEHWDGVTWSIVPSPNPAPFSILQGTTQIPGTTNVWAVGLYQISTGATQTLTASYC